MTKHEVVAVGLRASAIAAIPLAIVALCMGWRTVFIDCVLWAGIVTAGGTD